MVLHTGDPNRFARGLFTGLPRRYDVLADVLSLGQNARWQAAAVDRVASASPGRVLDVATGTGQVALRLAARTTAHVTGLDLTWAMLERGARNVEHAGAGDRVELVAGRGEQLPFPDATFDGLTFTYLLRYVADPAATLAELARVVRPGGVVASLEFHVPPNRFWRAWWWAYTRALLPAAGLVTGGPRWYRVGRFLGPNITAHYRHYPLDWHVDAWRRAGLDDVHARVMSLGGGLVMWGTRAHG